MVNAIELVIGTAIAGIIAVVGLAVMNTALVFVGIGNSQLGAFGIQNSAHPAGSMSLGLWGLLPLLFPFIIVAVLLIGIYALFRAYAGD